MKTFELKPINRQKSFYKKAIVIDSETGLMQLKSYETIVAEYNTDTNEIKVFGYYSPTTMRHINAFFDYCGFDTCTKKELEDNYLNN